MTQVEATSAAARTETTDTGYKTVYWVLGLILFGYALSLVVRANGASTTWIDGWGVAAYELVVSVLVLIRAAVSPRDRNFCLWLGAGMCLWALGAFAMTYESIHNANPPTPVLANYLWAAFFPVAYVGVMLLMRQEVRKFTAANYLDGVVATLTCATAFAAFAFGAIQKAAGDDSVTVAWNLIYPVGDILLLVLTLAAAAMLPPARAAGLALLILFVGSLNHINQIALGLATATLVAAGSRFGLALLRLRALTDERHQQLADSAQHERESREVLQSAVRDYSEFAAKVADGDLRATVIANASEDLSGLSESLNSMVGGLAEISGHIQAGVQDIGTSTADILASVSRHTESASLQSAAINQTSSTVNELRLAAEDTAQMASEVADRANNSLQVSGEATDAVAAITRAMEEIRERVDAMARDIITLSERTKQIGEITATVNGLADKSKLLALNASIEAARAGEHGKGFAVVAEEVTKLAEQSKAATSQVEAILGDVQTATTAAVLASQEGTKVVERGLELTERAVHGGCAPFADGRREAERTVDQLVAVTERYRV